MLNKLRRLLIRAICGNEAVLASEESSEVWNDWANGVDKRLADLETEQQRLHHLEMQDLYHTEEIRLLKDFVKENLAAKKRRTK